MLRTRPVLTAAIGSSLLAVMAMSPVARAQESSDPAMRSYLSANGLLSRGMYDMAEKDYREFLSAIYCAAGCAGRGGVCAGTTAGD